MQHPEVAVQYDMSLGGKELKQLVTSTVSDGLDNNWQNYFFTPTAAKNPAMPHHSKAQYGDVLSDNTTINLWLWKMTLFVAQCDAEETKHNLKSSAKNMPSNGQQLKFYICWRIYNRHVILG
jgi:hypothetical protein